MRYLRERDTFIEHAGEWPLTLHTPVTGKVSIQFPRGTAVEPVTEVSKDGYLIVRADGTEFYHWVKERDLLVHQPKDARLWSRISWPHPVAERAA